jgi:hypothetical protein
MRPRSKFVSLTEVRNEVDTGAVGSPHRPEALGLHAREEAVIRCLGGVALDPDFVGHFVEGSLSEPEALAKSLDKGDLPTVGRYRRACLFGQEVVDDGYRAAAVDGDLEDVYVVEHPPSLSRKVDPLAVGPPAFDRVDAAVVGQPLDVAALKIEGVDIASSGPGAGKGQVAAVG